MKSLGMSHRTDGVRVRLSSVDSSDYESSSPRGLTSTRTGSKFSHFSSHSKNRSSDSSYSDSSTFRFSSSQWSFSSTSLSFNSSSSYSSKIELENRECTDECLSPEERAKIAQQHAQFGPIGSQRHRYTSSFRGSEFPATVEEEPSQYCVITTYISYLILILIGHIRDFFGKWFRKERYKHLLAHDGYAPLNSDFEEFYVRRLKTRINDCFARPTTGVPGRFITLLDRVSRDHNSTFELNGSTTDTLNLSSYNYLGFAQSVGPCADAVEESIRRNGVSLCSPRADAGTSSLHLVVESLIAKFLGKEDAIVFSMGFSTNSVTIAALVGKGSLVLSDQFNHSSIRNGSRLSGAMIEMFRHNDFKHLETLLRKSVAQGQPRTHRPWRKILVAVEGLYSMEGTICNLPGLLALKKKYKFFLFIDEAHSVGALGPNGRGVCDYFHVDPGEVDILMGTLTKSYGANGGYIAASKSIIGKLRVTNALNLFGESPMPPVLTQIASSLRIITGETHPGQGYERLQRLAFNSRYLRFGLRRMGFIVYGNDDSPIIPLLLYNPAKMPAFSREMLKFNISVVVVGYPATPLISARARLCISAAHTKDDLDLMLRACDILGDQLQVKFKTSHLAGKLKTDELELLACGALQSPSTKLIDLGEGEKAEVEFSSDKDSYCSMKVEA